MIENKNRNKLEDASIAVAEENRELDWKSKSFIGSIFMGDLDMSMADPYPLQTEPDKIEGDLICEKVEAWCKDNLDGEEIDRTGNIPDNVWRGLATLGLFGIKIPREYGGLGLSQTNYMRVLGVVSRYCGSTAATLSAHQSIGVPQPLKLFGTEEQKQKYLPRFAKGEISAFALTEPSVGSDPAKMSTTAEKDEDGNWILNGHKLWCTNGVVADVIVVMARTPSIEKNGREVKQISAFIVETNSPGVEVLHRCEFMGLRAIENGLLKFDNVKVPAENLIWDEGSGLRLALTTLNDGRLSIPAICAELGEEISEFCAQWSKSREQWGKNVGDHEAGSTKLANISAAAYAMTAFSNYCAALSDGGKLDMRMEAAGAKLFSTELSWKQIDEALQLRGGRGYETATSLQKRGEPSYPIERTLRDARINRIVEGTTDVMHLFLAREALDPHLKRTGTLFKKNSSLMDKVKTIFKAGIFYSKWYPSLWFRNPFKYFGDFDYEVQSQLRWVESKSKKLARTLFHQMLLKGPKLEMRQNTLARIVEIGIELGVMAIVLSKVHSDKMRREILQAKRGMHWVDIAKLRVDSLFRSLNKNNDVAHVKLATALMANVEPLPEAVIPEDLGI